MGNETVSIEASAGRVGRRLAQEISQDARDKRSARYWQDAEVSGEKHGDEAINPVMNLLIAGGVGVKSVSSSKPSYGRRVPQVQQGQGASCASMADIRKARDRIRKG